MILKEIEAAQTDLADAKDSLEQVTKVGAVGVGSFLTVGFRNMKLFK